MEQRKPFQIFISSVQKELAEDRRAVKRFIESNPLLQRFFKAFLFEDLPAADLRADEVYLAEVDRSAVYVGLLGNEYGSEDSGGLSPTEREFDRATAQGITRLIFIKGTDDKQRRHAKMRRLIRKAGNQLIRRKYKDIDELKNELNASLVDYLENCGVIQDCTFEERAVPESNLADLDATAVVNFVRLARTERQFPLAETAPMADVLTHLHLLHEGLPTNAALLLFGRDPQRFLHQAEVRCMHFHGTEIQRPVPFYRIFKGNLFEQADMSVDFVMSKLNRGVGTRAESTRAPVHFEILPDVIREAIVNAIVHRDYTSAGAVQVSVFADRVEVWNPGVLPEPLTPESLRQPHGSLCRNQMLCEVMFLARYIEKYGTGTLMMIRESLAQELPEPDFIQCGGEFTVTLWRDWLTTAFLAAQGFNKRQLEAIKHVKQIGRISNAQYREITGTSESTALRELRQLTANGILEKVGVTGQLTYYVRAKRKPTIQESGRNPS